ncbi:MAG: fimbrillin family protein [Rikenellaceae bacterium]
MNRIFCPLVLFVVFACGCAESLDEASSVSPGSVIDILTVTAPDTRGVVVGRPDDMLSLGIYCAYSGSDVWKSGVEFAKLNDDRFSLSSDGRWSMDGVGVDWGYESLSDHYTFLAYSPHVDDAEGISSRIVDGELIIDYRVPSSSADQPDLMYAEPRRDINPQLGGSVSLLYHHTLASVSFSVVSSNGVMIDDIYIKGIVGDGSLGWDYGTNAPLWIPGDVSKEYFMVEVGDYVSSANSSVRVNSDGGYLMMIPQKLTDGVEVLLMLDNGEQRSLTIPAGSEWVAGAMYNYEINLDGDECYFVYDSDQQSNCYIINPVKGKRSIIQIPIEDRINYFWENYTNNKDVRISTSTSTDEVFVDMVWHDFDEQFEFLYDVVYDDDEKMAVLFDVDSKYREGNFVFVVYQIEINGNQLNKSPLWSWHLWFTDYNPDAIAAANIDKIQMGVDSAYELDGYEGAVHRYKDGADAGECVWSGIYGDKFIMDRNIGERDEFVGDYGVGSVYYQFGRKDPFPGNSARDASGRRWQPSTRTTSSLGFDESVWYNDDYVASTSSGSGNWSDEEAARKYSCIWFDSAIPLSGYDEGKSIFDPSPLGWRVPVSDTWSDFDDNDLNYDLSDDDECDDKPSVGRYSYYGYRDPYNKSTPSLSGVEGSVWSANPCDAERGYYLRYSTSKIRSPRKRSMIYGLPVRAIQE